MQRYFAGALNVIYDHGSIRRICYGDLELVRMIYFALRDANWGTVPYVIEDEHIAATSDQFIINFKCSHKAENGPIINWQVTIEGTSDSVVVFSIDGTVLRNFKKNRVGFCVLHPLKDVMGTEVQTVNPEGEVSKGKMPDVVHPFTPFTGIQRMRWKIRDHWFALDFTGDVFEMEDQRNWGDASFKTYGTPIRIPFPVELNQGDRISQSIRFSPMQILRPTPVADQIALSLSDIRFSLPPLGVGASAQTNQLDKAHISLLRALQLHHYRIDVDLTATGWQLLLIKRSMEASELNLLLEIVLLCGKDCQREISTFLDYCAAIKIEPYSILLLQKDADVTTTPLFELMPLCRKKLPGSKIGVGTNYNLTEINRNRFTHTDFDFISYAWQPQEHASDDLTLFENIESISHGVATAKTMYGEATRVFISPVTLKRRFNPYATDPQMRTMNDHDRTDPRLCTAFGAAWLFSHLCAISLSGASSVTYFQTMGMQGLMSVEGQPYPIYDVFALLPELLSSEAFHLDSTHPLDVQGLIIKDKFAVIANLTSEEKVVTISNAAVHLRPYELKRVAHNAV